VRKSIGYHTRLANNSAIKVCWGSFGGSLDLETANRLVKAHFTVVAKPTGTLVFVDREGREVSLFITVDPARTEAGKLAREEFNRQKAIERQNEDRKREELEDVLGWYVC